MSHEKIYVIKPTVEIGRKLGCLPGRLDEKREPYTRSICELALKLHPLRPANQIFREADQRPPVFNPRFFGIPPLNDIRGMNIEQAVVIIDADAESLPPGMSHAVVAHGRGGEMLPPGGHAAGRPPRPQPREQRPELAGQEVQGQPHLCAPRAQRREAPRTDHRSGDRYGL